MKTKPLPTLTQEEIDRFWSKVDRSGGPDACWEWQAGKVRERNGKLGYGHLDPGERLVCHDCDNPACCNPSHYFLGDHAINHADKVRKSRQAKCGDIGNAKVTESQIHELRHSHLSSRAMGKQLGVSHRSVLLARRRETWKHVI